MIEYIGVPPLPSEQYVLPLTLDRFLFSYKIPVRRNIYQRSRIHLHPQVRNGTARIESMITIHRMHTLPYTRPSVTTS